MLASGSLIAIPNGTPCTVLEPDDELCKVRIEDGAARGRIAWVFGEFVRP
jgi:hypothetical protein